MEDKVLSELMEMAKDQWHQVESYTSKDMREAPMRMYEATMIAIAALSKDSRKTTADKQGEE